MSFAGVQVRIRGPAARFDFGNKIAAGKQVVPEAGRCSPRHAIRGRDYRDFAHDPSYLLCSERAKTWATIDAGPLRFRAS